MFIELPHIILHSQIGAGLIHMRSSSALIRVYKMEGAVLHLVKCIRFGIEGLCELRPIANKVRLGFVEKRNKAAIVHVFEKRKLFAAGLSPRRDDFFKTEETERRRIEVEGNPVAMNSYCLLSFHMDGKEVVSSDLEKEHGLMKKDFWM